MTDKLFGTALHLGLFTLNEAFNIRHLNVNRNSKIRVLQKQMIQTEYCGNDIFHGVDLLAINRHNVISAQKEWQVSFFIQVLFLRKLFVQSLT